MLPENQTPTNSPSMPPLITPKPSRGMKYLAIGLGFGMLVFAGLAVVALMASNRSKAVLDSANQRAFGRGQTEQKKADDERYLILNESPYRSYVAPGNYGGFEIKFPKNWSGYVIESADAHEQINLTINPDFVKQVVGSDNVYALHVLLVRNTYDQVMRQHQDDVKQKKIKVNKTSVSGIDGSRYEGKFDGKHDGSTVIIPVRDKTIVIATDDKKYLPEYNQILAQAHIVP